MVAKASGGGSASLATTGDGAAREPIRARIASASAVLPRSASASANASAMESAAPSVNARVGSVTRYSGGRAAVGASRQEARTRAIAAIEVQCAMAILLFRFRTWRRPLPASAGGGDHRDRNARQSGWGSTTFRLTEGRPGQVERVRRDES